MKKTLKSLLANKWFLLLALVLASYLYAGVYERAAVTPIDEMREMMSAVAEEESFAEAYADMDWGMSLEEYQASAQNVTVLKSRYLQGPLSFLTSLLSLVTAVLICQACLRIGERRRGLAPATRLAETIDVTLPAALAEAAKYLIFTLWVLLRRTLPDYSLALSVAAALLSCAAPYLLNCLHRRREGKPYGTVAIGGAAASAVAIAFQLL